MIVFIERLRVFGPIGWYPEERKNGVELWISAEIEILNDVVDENIDHTIDYLQVAELIQTEASMETRLLETLAESCIEAILNFYRHLTINKIKIRIEKQLQDKIGLVVQGVGIEKTYTVLK